MQRGGVQTIYLQTRYRRLSSRNGRINRRSTVRLRRSCRGVRQAVAASPPWSAMPAWMSLSIRALSKVGTRVATFRVPLRLDFPRDFAMPGSAISRNAISRNAMSHNATQKLIAAHLVEGEMKLGEEIGLRIDQTLTQDATGTLVMLELEAMQLDRVQTEISAQYVDHNLLQTDNKNPEDHLFLQSACRRFGLWYSGPGGGVSHPLHQQHFGKPGKTLLGSDSHTPAAGAIGMLAIGAGGLEVAMAMAGRPFYVNMPKVWGVRLAGELPPWVSAKDVILEMLRRHGVKGAVGCVLEYYGDGLRQLSVMDRHVIANMGTELGATSTVFPTDEAVHRFLARHGREADFEDLQADEGANYDRHDEIDLSRLEPLIAMPSSPGNVSTVREQSGADVYQAYLGSSANPGYRDFAVPAEMVRDRRIAAGVSLDINPTSRQSLLELMRDGHVSSLLAAGARLHQAGCNGCIGMGQAPAKDKLSLRTVPRNFPGRSGTDDDQVCLVSPETATASALTGRVTDPRTLDRPSPRVVEPREPPPRAAPLVGPVDPQEARGVELVKGGNIVSLPEFEPLPGKVVATVLLKVGDNISTDEIMPAGARVLPFRSNIPQIAQFVFGPIDDGYPDRAKACRDEGGHFVLGGHNYGQGSSREHAALAPRYLGLRGVIAKSFARIHRQNLVNFGVLPLVFENERDFESIERDARLRIVDARQQIQRGESVTVEDLDRDVEFAALHQLSPRQIDVVLAGGLINWTRQAV
ncbi:MAG: aconitate hydratase [Pirellulaceae bacterium]